MTGTLSDYIGTYIPKEMRSGGKGSGIYKSIDGGTTWKKLSKGLPKEMGKTDVSVSGSKFEVYREVQHLFHKAPLKE